MNVASALAALATDAVAGLCLRNRKMLTRIKIILLAGVFSTVLPLNIAKAQTIARPLNSEVPIPMGTISRCCMAVASPTTARIVKARAA